MSATRSYRAGLTMLAVLSALDLLTPLLTDGEHPPMAVAVAAAVLGLASLSLVVAAWQGSRRAMSALVVLRMLSALSATPAFFAHGVPVAAVAAATGLIILTLVGVGLVIGGTRRSDLAGAR